jgi:SusD family.
MKHQKYSILLLSLFTLGSCHHMLDVEPHTFSSGASYYQNEGQFLRAVNGAYGSLQELYTVDHFWPMTEMVADNTNYQFDASDRGAQQREEIDEFLITSTNNYVNNTWNMLYRNIQQINVILGRIEPVEFSDEAKKAQYKGEAQFLRALQYFHLVRLFGPVPLIIDEVEDPESAFSGGRASVEEVYNQILADVNGAIENLPASYTGSDMGRATKGAALTLLGEVQMTLHNFDEAAAAFQQVLDMGYSLLPNYADNFDPAFKNNAESVFAVQFDAGLQTEASNFIFMFGPRNAKDKLIGFPGNLGGSNIPTPSIYRAYEEGDVRRDASIALFSDPSNANFEESQAFGGDIPFIQKYYHPPFLEDGRADENWPVYRYAHVLLMLAEALNETGAGDPYPYINAVRERAGLDPLAGLDQEAFREAVAHEQRVELAFENHRWYQLLRTGKAIEVMTQHGIEEKERLTRLSDAAYNIQTHKLLFPIPEREIRLNGFEQNPGW